MKIFIQIVLYVSVAVALRMGGIDAAKWQYWVIMLLIILIASNARWLE